ncbi:MAG: Gfo/Idh/MocA family protein [Planctomycetota bacterium]
MTEKKFRVAFCGCGRIAYAHAEELAKLENVELCAYWNRTTERAKEMYETLGGDYYAEDFKRIAEDKSIDAVYINNMHNDRIDIVKAMGDNGKAIFSEKPLAHNAEMFREIYKYVKENNIYFWSGVKIRFNTIMKKAVEYVNEPELLSAHVLDENWPDNFLNDPDVGGGNVLSQGIYALETMRLLAGCRPVAVTALTSNKRHSFDTVDTLSAAFEFENGAIGSITVGDAGLAPQPISKFYASVSGNNKTLVIYDRFQQFEYLDKVNEESETFTHEEDGFFIQSKEFFRCGFQSN